jgi:translation initiation factor 5B
MRIQAELEKKEEQEKEQKRIKLVQKKEREKSKRQERKAKGLILTAKQKHEKKRMEATVEAWKEKGAIFPSSSTTEKKVRPGTRVRPKKEKVKVIPFAEAKPEGVTEEAKVNGSTPEPVPVEKIPNNWEELLGGESEEQTNVSEPIISELVKEVEKPPNQENEIKDEENEFSFSEENEFSSDWESDESIKFRLQNRRKVNEKKRSLDHLRAPVICVLGHVDTGKTKILDFLRCTKVQDSEAGGITQQIGATNVPIDALREQLKIGRCLEGLKVKIPGLLIIDTPGHEHFGKLRSRGSSLCDLAILVVDIMHGVEPQTIESIKLLQDRGTPFIVALNKIYRLFEGQSNPKKDIRDVLKSQKPNTKLEFEQRSNSALLQLSEQGLNTKLFYENPDPKEYSSVVPTSAITGDGIANLIAMVVRYNDQIQPEKLTFSEELEATVLEVKPTTGHGTTIDVILTNGSLKVGDTMVLPGFEGPIVTQIRALLLPKPMRELRVKNEYAEPKKIKASQGVKISAKKLDLAIAGSSFLVANSEKEVEILKKEISQEKEICIQCKKRGVYVQASSLGSLEALLEFLNTSKIPYSNTRIGDVEKSDVVKASVMLETDPQFACILAFDVKVDRKAQEHADAKGVTIFKKDVIYHLFDDFTKHREDRKQKGREEFKNIAVFPCKLHILPQHIYRQRHPIIVGVLVEAGVVKIGTPLCVPSKDFLQIGVVATIEKKEKPVEMAQKGEEVCLKIDYVSDDTPKMIGRHFNEKDVITSIISRQSIDACKEHFRDDLTMEDWRLMKELKGEFGIL